MNMALWCCRGVCPVIAFVRWERDGAYVWLSRGFVGSSSILRPRSRHLRVCYFLDCLSRVCLQAPQFPLLWSLLQRCFRSAAGQRFRSLLVRRSYCLLSLSPPLSRDPVSLSQQALSGLPEPMTQLEQQLSSFELTPLFGIDS